MLSIVDRASEVLQDDTVTVREIHNATGISDKVIKEAKSSKDITTFVNNLKYAEVLALADLFNDIQIQFINQQNDNDFYKFVVRMGEWFEEAIGIQEEYYDSEEGLDDDLMIATAIQTLNDISTKNKSLMLDLYFSYSRDEQSMK
ncbi:hypothetical protein FD29_GL001609 [Companilactobacillus mindensis DSM 14500]|uniref:Uncharacterized protein n=1 Tax=Companilactobacillus mindensis DSM 14500 TaxID=1423770 RepID=A0A0R1QNM4_9LACO|nr:hypothetical protein [Companilactobacillus mindensis]KRL42739.1 hypothetical protein FD29_GL001609 [Companilactobacillus mindensis DSM 14500]GEO79056.1 hypothetical protein LMI01_13870 [Companilactobacillus mindensis]